MLYITWLDTQLSNCSKDTKRNLLTLQLVQQKRKMFVSILRGMKSDGNNADSTSVWTEFIDCGGLFHVDTPTYELELIECKVRQHLHSTTMQPDQHHQAAIIADVVNDKLLLEK